MNDTPTRWDTFLDFIKTHKAVTAVAAIALIAALVAGGMYLTKPDAPAPTASPQAPITVPVEAPNPEFVAEGTSQEHLAAPQEAVATGPSVPKTISINGGETMTVPIGHVGPDDAATLAPPEDLGVLGWYAASAQPGSKDQGTIVMTGHVNYAGETGYAARITNLKEGDIVTVTTEDGAEHKYRVARDTYSVYKASDNTTPEQYVEATKDTLGRAHGPEALILLTCGGTFVPGSPTGYDSNMIAEAYPID